MNSKRTRSLWDKSSPALTPELRAPMGELSREQLIAQNLDLKRITSAERRRHAAVERTFVQSLDALQNALDRTREAYIASVALRPSQSDKGRG
jgi:hypothetical protein